MAAAQRRACTKLITRDARIFFMRTAYRVLNVIIIIRFKGQIWRAGNRIRPTGSALRTAACLSSNASLTVSDLQGLTW